MLFAAALFATLDELPPGALPAVPMPPAAGAAAPSGLLKELPNPAWAAAAEPGAWLASAALGRVEPTISEVLSSAEPRPPPASGGPAFVIWSGEGWEAIGEELVGPEGAGVLPVGVAAAWAAPPVPDAAGGALGPVVDIAARGVVGSSSIAVLANFGVGGGVEDGWCRIGAMTGSMAIQAVCMTRRGRFGGAPGGSIAPARKNAAEATAAKP
ncbi:MAG TPA: hypothetical protein VKB42_08930 [Dongiaceae bacterium]|nr:hypothetical protein [Dongiaceae bacterium]